MGRFRDMLRSFFRAAVLRCAVGCNRGWAAEGSTADLGCVWGSYETKPGWKAGVSAFKSYVSYLRELS
eukprot:2892703-Pyramimonas_sp.AAC.1